jgi:hypothetical protein
VFLGSLARGRLVTGPLEIVLFLGSIVPALAVPAHPVNVEVRAAEAAEALYREAGVAGLLEREVLVAGYQAMERHGLGARVLAIADLTQPSTVKRLFIFDLEERRLMLRTWVAHGQNSGGLKAERFSNRNGSHQTSLGLYRVGRRIVSPKHGPALLLDGLDRGLNDLARRREVIIHGADYVSRQFIEAYGRLGRSWGCPAVPRDDMAEVMDLLAEGGLLYVAGNLEG